MFYSWYRMAYGFRFETLSFEMEMFFRRYFLPYISADYVTSGVAYILQILCVYEWKLVPQPIFLILV